MREKKKRNENLIKKWETGKYTIRTIGRMFKISHVRVLVIIKRSKKKNKR